MRVLDCPEFYKNYPATETDGNIAEGLEDNENRDGKTHREVSLSGPCLDAALQTWTRSRDWRNTAQQKLITHGGSMWTKKRKAFKTPEMFKPGDQMAREMTSIWESTLRNAEISVQPEEKYVCVDRHRE